MTTVLDASALLAFLHDEPGGDQVAPMLSYCQFWCMSTESQAALRSVLDGSVCSTPSMN